MAAMPLVLIDRCFAYLDMITIFVVNLVKRKG